MGKWDAAKGENVMNKDAKMNNRSLRQAIAYGMNVDQVYKEILIRSFILEFQL